MKKYNPSNGQNSSTNALVVAIHYSPSKGIFNKNKLKNANKSHVSKTKGWAFKHMFFS
jgi:hypothetical protein